jgi:hypothetical protein
MTALQDMKDRNNPNRFDQPIPTGLSQRSYLPEIDNDSDIQLNDWDYGIEENSVGEDHQGSRAVLSRHWNEMSEAFTNSKEKETLEQEFIEVMNKFIVRARGSAAVPFSSQGHRVSMLPESSKRRKTHGTSHY